MSHRVRTEQRGWRHGAWFMACPPCSSTASSPRPTQEGWRTRFSSKDTDPNTNRPPSTTVTRVYIQCSKTPFVSLPAEAVPTRETVVMTTPLGPFWRVWFLGERGVDLVEG